MVGSTRREGIARYPWIAGSPDASRALLVGQLSPFRHELTARVHLSVQFIRCDARCSDSRDTSGNDCAIMMGWPEDSWRKCSWQGPVEFAPAFRDAKQTRCVETWSHHKGQRERHNVGTAQFEQMLRLVQLHGCPMIWHGSLAPGRWLHPRSKDALLIGIARF